MPFRVRAKSRWRHFFKEWREHRGLTQEEVAGVIGMSHASLSRIENDKQDYTGAVLEALAEVYGTDPGTLLMRHPRDQYTAPKPR
jgi:transcriptional regulator with XRE-family HTH domain